MLPDGQLEALLAPARERQASLRAQLWGSGAIAQGTGAQAVGERGIGARDFQGVAVTGDHNMVILASEAAAAFWRQFAGPHAAASQDVGPHSVSLQVSKAELERATARYLELLLDRYRYLDFRGMGVSDRVPLRLPLVQFIAAYCCHRGMDLPVQAMLQEALAQGGALLLLDGLDEVRDLSRRHLVVERVVDCFVAHRAQGNKFVLTSRVVGYREVRPVCEGLIECTLVDFGQDEIEAFVDKWTAALERAARGDTPLAIVEAERERRELLEAVQRNPGVRDLAANPLLLTVLALMKRQGVTLPERRVQLYDQYVQTLLSSWNRARGLGRPPARDLDVVETMRSLAPLALWMHQVSPGVGLVRQGDLQRQLQEVYSTRGEADPERAARVRRAAPGAGRRTVWLYSPDL